jgi:hypothetical protein
MVLPALVLALLTAPGRRADADTDADGDRHLGTAGGAVLGVHADAVARISGRVEAAYRGYQVSQVLPWSVPLAVPEGDQQFGVELVLPGRGTCWLHVALPDGDRPARLYDLPRGAQGCPSNARRPRRP